MKKYRNKFSEFVESERKMKLPFAHKRGNCPPDVFRSLGKNHQILCPDTKEKLRPRSVSAMGAEYVSVRKAAYARSRSVGARFSVLFAAEKGDREGGEKDEEERRGEAAALGERDVIGGVLVGGFGDGVGLADETVGAHAGVFHIEVFVP